MFLISFSKSVLKSKKIKYMALVSLAVAAVLLVTVVFSVLAKVPDSAYCEALGEYSLLAETESEREEFFGQFGLSAESLSATSVKIPEWGEAFEEYNELQRSQGLELKSYCGKSAQQYVLSLSSESGSGASLFGVLTVYRNRVVAVHLTDFLYPSEILSLSEVME